MKRINIGCGLDYKDGWHNVDINPKFEPDQVQDLEETEWNIETDTYHKILVDNVFEHIDPRMRPNFLSECHRILKTGGKMVMKYPTPGYGVGWDVSHYPIPHWNWAEHPNNRDSWNLDKVEITKHSFGRLLPDNIAKVLMWHGIRTVQGVEIYVTATEKGMEEMW